MQRTTQKSCRAEHGSVMVLTMLVTLVILGVGITAIMLSSSGMKMSGNLNRRQEAISSAEVGLERGVATLLASVPDWNALLDGTAGCTAHAKDDLPTVGNMGRKGRVLCETATNTNLADVKVLLGVAEHQLDMMTYTVWIKNDPLEVSYIGASAINADSDNRVVLRVEGVGRDGLSFFAVETTVTVPSTFGTEDEYSQAGGGGHGGNSGPGNLAAATGP